ncbi:MAG: carbohydrate ABC transporter permease [Deltaproteobacteria bacterium]|nr:carbohydrate ABC transporter permease [Deltaproteobacteria bacterium]
MRRALSIAALAVFVVAALAPLVWCIYASLVPDAALFHATAPVSFSATSYRTVLFERAFAQAIGSSLIVASATTALALVLGAPCAYALARLRMRGKRVILAVVLGVSMFPQISIVGPLFLVLKSIGLIDTRPGLVLPYVTFALPLAVWLLSSFFKDLPREIEEAARVDGAGALRILVDIILPLSLPGLATTAIFTFVYCWNELVFALSFTVSPEQRTIPVAITMLRGSHQVPWSQILAASTLATVPVALLVLVAQRFIVKGLVAGAVKG